MYSCFPAQCQRRTSKREELDRKGSSERAVEKKLYVPRSLLTIDVCLTFLLHMFPQHFFLFDWFLAVVLLTNTLQLLQCGMII